MGKLAQSARTRLLLLAIASSALIAPAGSANAQHIDEYGRALHEGNRGPISEGVDRVPTGTGPREDFSGVRARTEGRQALIEDLRRQARPPLLASQGQAFTNATKRMEALLDTVLRYANSLQNLAHQRAGLDLNLANRDSAYRSNQHGLGPNILSYQEITRKMHETVALMDREMQNIKGVARGFYLKAQAAGLTPDQVADQLRVAERPAAEREAMRSLARAMAANEAKPEELTRLRARFAVGIDGYSGKPLAAVAPAPALQPQDRGGFEVRPFATDGTGRTVYARDRVEIQTIWGERIEGVATGRSESVGNSLRHSIQIADGSNVWVYDSAISSIKVEPADGSARFSTDCRPTHQEIADATRARRPLEARWSRAPASGADRIQALNRIGDDLSIGASALAGASIGPGLLGR